MVSSKDNLFLRFNRHERRCLFHEPLNVSHAEVPTSRKAQVDTHLIFNDIKVLIKVHNSKFHCRYEEKHNKVFWLQYVLAQTCFSFSVLQYTCLSVYLRDIQVFPQTALPSISHPRGLCLGGFICSCVLQKPPAFTRKDYKVGVHSGFVCSGACLQSICIVKTVG